MAEPLVYDLNKATAKQIQEHLQKCSASFIPVLETRLDIAPYAIKIYQQAMRFEAWEAGSLVGLVAAYFNDTAHRNGFITNVSVLPEKAGRGIAREILGKAIDYAIAHRFADIQLEVHPRNVKAIRLYQQAGFEPAGQKGDQLLLKKQLAKI